MCKDDDNNLLMSYNVILCKSIGCARHLPNFIALGRHYFIWWSLSISWKQIILNQKQAKLETNRSAAILSPITWSRRMIVVCFAFKVSMLFVSFSRELDKLMGTTFFEDSNFGGLVEKIRDRNRKSSVHQQAVNDQVNRLFSLDASMWVYRRFCQAYLVCNY